jgi:hypothetical protein
MPVPFPRHTKWATTGDNAEFLWSAIGLPFTRSLPQERAGAVIVTRQSAATGHPSLSINDRAHVVGGLIVAQSFVIIGVDAVVGDIRARGQVILRDRATTGAIVTSNVVHPSAGVVTGTQQQGAFQKFEDFNLTNAPAAVVSSSTNVANGQVLSLAAGDHGIVTVFAGGTLSLGAGTHTFKNLQLESNSTMRATAGVTRVFIASGGTVIMRGAVVGNAANILIGMPSAGGITIGNAVNGTIVAPNADVVGDMVDGATLRGAYFVKSFELHQGRFLFFVPFAGGAWVP